MQNHLSCAPTPPMGWNSWDCFGLSVTEDEVKANADFMAQHLKQYGWEYVVVDLGWYSPDANPENYKKFGLANVMDENGRLIPCPLKFPSSANGAGFKPLADYVHSLGLKFGIHIMRGMPWQAGEEASPILNSHATCADIMQKADRCYWYANTYGIDCTREGAQEYYNSLTELYASWGVDFIKADDMNSWDGEGEKDPYHTDEIEALATAIANSGRPMALSLSPGAARICNAKHLRDHANMWRISYDFWDDWDAMLRQFKRCDLWSHYVTEGAWPDADMLPMGKIGIRGEVGTARLSNFNEPELYTLMTLWCICRSPLMFGGHLPESDDLSIKLITNADVIKVNQQSSNNRQLWHTPPEKYGFGDAAWVADAPDGGQYLALFNLSDHERELSYDLSRSSSVKDLWTGQELGTLDSKLTTSIAQHGAALFHLAYAESSSPPPFES